MKLSKKKSPASNPQTKKLGCIASFVIWTCFFFFGLIVVSVFLNSIEYSLSNECQENDVKSYYCYIYNDAQVADLTEKRYKGKLNMYVVLLRQDGHQETSQVFDEVFWKGLKKGETVRIEIWRNLTRSIEKDGQSFSTEKKPFFDFRTFSFVFKFLLLFLLAIPVLIFLFLSFVLGLELLRDLRKKG